MTGGWRWPRCGPAGGDAPVAPGCRSPSCSGPLEDGLRLAAELGDRRAEADFTSRLTVLEASRLRLASPCAGRSRGWPGRARRRRRTAVVLALDGVKTVRRLPRRRDRPARGRRQSSSPCSGERQVTWLLQWAVFESAFVPAADAATGTRPRRPLVDEALELNRAQRVHGAYAGYFQAHAAGWPGSPATSTQRAPTGRRAVDDDLAGRPSVVVRHGRRAARRHPARDRRRATRRRPSRGAGWRRLSRTPRGRAGCAAWRRRSLAAVTGEGWSEATPTRSPRSTARPAAPGSCGADCLPAARGRRSRARRRAEAARLLAPLREATPGSWPALRRRVERSTGARVRAARRPAEPPASAPSVGTGR